MAALWDLRPPPFSLLPVLSKEFIAGHGKEGRGENAAAKEGGIFLS